MAINTKGLVAEWNLTLALLVLVFAKCADTVFYTRIAYEYVEFLWYLSNVVLPIACVVTTAPVVWYKLYFTNDITDEMRAFPQYKFAIMAFLDVLANMFGSLPMPHIGGNLANVFDQLILPINMVMSYFFLSSRFKRSHIIGAILVMYGGMVVMIPVLAGFDDVNIPDPTVGWISLYMISLIPSAGGNVYKEIGLKDVDLDVWYVNAWSSFYQLVLGVASIWTIRFKAFSDPPVEWSDFSSYLVSAHQCFMGEAIEYKGQQLPCDTGVLHIFVIYFAFNLTCSQLTLYIFKEGSSVLLVISTAVCLPLTDLLYMIPFLTGSLAGQEFTIYDGFALFVLVMGVVVYYSEKEERHVESNQSIETTPMYTSPTVQKIRVMRKKRGKPVFRQIPMVVRGSGGASGESAQQLLGRDGGARVKGYGTSITKKKASLA